ncbi:MAG: hypothetical protein AB8G18_07720 [Gammaproteobacteria bacterium]
MFLNTERTDLTQRRSRTSMLLLLVAAFLFSQSLAQAHVHADGELGTACVMCHHADDSPALLTGAAQAPFTDCTEFLAQHACTTAPASQPQDNYLSRAPPTIQ